MRTALLTRDPLPEVKDAYITVSREESHRGVLESSSVTEAKLNASSFAAKSFNNNRRGFVNNNNNTRSTNPNTANRGPNPNLNCKNCGKIGHTIERCYEIIGFPSGFVKKMPIGINITGRVMEDDVVLNLANKLEETMEFKDQIAKEEL